MKNKDMFEGYSLFNNSSDLAIRNLNRATTLCNITEDNITKCKELSEHGKWLVMEYMKRMPKSEVEDITKQYQDGLLNKGLISKEDYASIQ